MRKWFKARAERKARARWYAQMVGAWWLSQGAPAQVEWSEDPRVHGVLWRMVAGGFGSNLSEAAWLVRFRLDALEPFPRTFERVLGK